VTFSTNRSLRSSPYPAASLCAYDDVPSDEVTNVSCTTCTHEASLNWLVNCSRVDATWSHCFGTKLHIMRNRETHRPVQLRTGFPCQKRQYSVRTRNSIQHLQAHMNNKDMGVHPVNMRSYGSDRQRPLTYLNEILLPNISTPITSILYAYEYCTYNSRRIMLAATSINCQIMGL